VIRQFAWQYTVIMAYNFLQTCLTLVAPFIIKYLIDYIKYGENPWADKFNFWDTSDISWLSWLTRDLQYGLTLVMILNLSQLLSYIIQENIWFWQQVLGAKSTNALIGLIYRKQLSVSLATNKLF
jgi:ABC-type multidrug transport system fused ATPase/permease subunit